MSDARPPARWIPSTARVGGTGVTPHQKHLLKTYLSTITCDPATIASAVAPVHLEIGFGAGEFMVAEAQARRDVLYIGCESYIRGVGRALSAIEKADVNNIRLWTKDARELLPQLPEACLDHVNLLFPDPWPKVRHHKRRIVSMAFLDLLARVMKPDGTLLMATDIPHYAAWMLERTLAHEAFHWQAESIADIRTKPQGWVTTRYQQKAIEEGRDTAYLQVQRR